MTKKRCPLGEACDLTIAWMSGAAKAQDQIKAQAAEIERLKAKLTKAVEALRFYAWEDEMRLPSDGPWGASSTDFGKIARTALAELTGAKP